MFGQKPEFYFFNIYVIANTVEYKTKNVFVCDAVIVVSFFRIFPE